MNIDSISKGTKKTLEEYIQKDISNSKQRTFSDTLILDIIMDNSQDTIYFKDRDSKFVVNSKAHAMQFGYDNPRDLIGKSDFDFFPKSFAKNAFEDEMEIIKTGKPIINKLEKWVTKDGDAVWFSASKYPIYDLNGDIIGTWGTSRDITSLKLVEEELARVNAKLEEANLQLKTLSNIDGLSELYNQRHFHEILEETVNRYKKNSERGMQKSFCIMLIDIDYFKLINDTYGHPIGDLAIKYVADLISMNTRFTDKCFRCGGDEFAVILFDTDIDTGILLAERLRTAIEKNPLTVNDIDITITVSIGITSYNGEENPRSMIQEVDKKLYISKREGRNQTN